MRQVADLAKPHWLVRASPNAPRVSVIVPARNEQQTIEAGLRSLLALEYRNYEIIAVNDRSTDETLAVMQRIATDDGRLKILNVEELPAGWLGKPHAMWRAAQQASGEWLLFTDADVIFRADTLARAVAYAEEVKCDHLPLFPTMLMERPDERVIMGFFNTFFLFGYRPWKLHDPEAADFAGVGAFNLIRRSAYDAIGTFSALRMEVIEDLKLGKLVKAAGLSQRAAFGRDLVRIRWAVGAAGIVQNLTKNFFAFMRFQWWRSLASCAGIVVLTLAPYAGVAFAPGWAKAGYAAALLGIFLVYAGMSAKCDIPAYYFVLHPVGGLLFVYTVLRSTLITLWQGGIVWRGTKYPLEELKRGLV